MKRIVTLSLIALTAIAAQAATIKWGASGTANYGSTLLKSGASTAYLVYLGENVSDWSGFSFADDFVGSRLASKDTTTYANIGSNSFIATEGSSLGGLDSVSANLTDKKSSFGVLFTTTQGGKDYYYLGDVFTFDTSSTSYNGTTKIFTATSTAAPSSSATWTEAAVPEPATGALALAGVALLFRRRRA